mmetsp:Transcript_251/g.840  ORF Transcript_251/g.840 Transcript_251/m.840 type:complete len:271 (+) Transcript_251:69-881(+)
MSRAAIELTTTATADGLSNIALKICSPPSPIAAAVFAHGGCFSDGCSQSHPAVTEALAGIGIATVSSTYRQGAAHPHPTAQHDLACVAEFARRRWPSLPLGVIGSSSGGWHALALSRTIEGMRFCVALCPVADPLLRAEYLRECVQGTAAVAGWRVCHEPSVAGRMLAKQLGYWGDDESMRAAGEMLLPAHAVPTMLVLGGVDKNVPLRVAEGVQGWAHRTLVLGGMGHEIQDAPPAANSWVPDVKAFVAGALVGTAAATKGAPCDQEAP